MALASQLLEGMNLTSSLQIKSLVLDGPAALDGKMETGMRHQAAGTRQHHDVLSLSLSFKSLANEQASCKDANVFPGIDEKL